MKTSRLRGQAELVGALLAVTALVLVLGYAIYTLYTFQLATTQTTHVRQSFEYERLAENILLKDTAQGLCVYNMGITPVKIVRIWYMDGNTSRTTLVNIEIAPGQSACGIETYVPGTITAIVTARGNVFKYYQPAKVQVASAQTAEIAQSVLLESIPVLGSTVEDLQDINTILIDPYLLNEPTSDAIKQEMVKGMKRYTIFNESKYFVLNASFENVLIELRGWDESSKTAEVGNIFIAYKPGNKSAYNILITLPGVDENCDKHRPVLVINGSYKIELSCINTNKEYTRDTIEDAWRIRIEGLVVEEFKLEYNDTIRDVVFLFNNVDDARGYWWYYGGFSKWKWRLYPWGSKAIVFVKDYVDVRVYIKGYAEKVTIYKEEKGQGKSSYTPYIFVGDVDGNGLAELLFTTEDSAPGSNICTTSTTSITIDDLGFYLDHSEINYTIPETLFVERFSNRTIPFLMYLSKFPIDSNKYSMVVITVRIYYHDSEGGDTKCVSDPQEFLVGFYLVDPGDDNTLNTYDDIIVTSNEFIYQQLDDYEDTFPPNTNFVTITVPLLVPNTGKTYYVAIGFIDPYDGGEVIKDEETGFVLGINSVDDVDFTVAIESIGITYYARG